MDNPWSCYGLITTQKEKQHLKIHKKYQQFII